MSRVRRAVLRGGSALAVASGFTVLNRTWRRRRRDFRLFILEYHDVSSTGDEFEGTISQRRFRRHLRFLKRRCRLTTLARAAKRLGSEDGLTEDLAVVTFDDGYAGNFEAAWPVLVEEQAPATIFVTTGFLDGSELWFGSARRALRAAISLGPGAPVKLRRELASTFGRWPLTASAGSAVERLKLLPAQQRDRLLAALRGAELRVEPAARPLTWDQVREMQKGGVEFGGHTVSHPILPSLPPSLQEQEIRACSERIDEETGQPPRSFAFPNGDYDSATLEIVQRLGYSAACTTRKGSNRSHCDPLTLRRIGVGSDSTRTLAARLSGLFDDEMRRRFTARR